MKVSDPCSSRFDTLQLHEMHWGFYTLRLVFVIGLLSIANGAFAHHSGAMFDRSQTVVLEGRVKEYQFANPHVWIELLVPDKGGREVQWSIEGEGPGMMARLGLGRTVLKAGDQVKVRAHPLRDGRPGGSFISLTFADGKIIGSAIVPPAAR